MFRVFAILYSIVFLAVGLMGFFPSELGNGLLFYIFRVNYATNILHILTGLGAIWAWLTSEKASRLFFQIIGVLLAIWGILGFLYEEDPLFGIIANSVTWTWFHVIFAVIALILGFGSNET